MRSDSIRRSPFEADIVRIVLRNHLVIGGGYEARLGLKKCGSSEVGTKPVQV